MATVAVCVELTFRDGQREQISIKVENSLSSLINGVRQLNANVSRVLNELVELEKTRGFCAEGEEEDEYSDEEDEEPEDPENSELKPPVKRSKT